LSLVVKIRRKQNITVQSAGNVFYRLKLCGNWGKIFAQKVRITSEIGAQNFKKPCAEFRIFWRRIPGALLAPLIARLTALCFKGGVFLTCYKTACITPLLKKTGLDVANVANYRPVSDLHTISNIVERLFLSRVISHVDCAPCFNRFQSAFVVTPPKQSCCRR
jgi:hypothetical protein